MTGAIDTGTETVRAWIDDGVGVIQLHRPDRSNALHEDMYEAIPALIQRYEADDAVGCLLVTAAGRAFCAGGDVRAGADRARRGEPRQQPADDGANPLVRMGRMVRMLHESPKISIAALPGPAVGAGIGIALSADLRIASHSAALIPGWGALGFSGDFGGTWFLTRLLGSGRALAALIDNTPISAEEALAVGVFNRVVDDAELADAAQAWAATIAAGPRSAYQWMKQNVNDAQRLSLAEFLPVESERMSASGRTDDHREAVKRWLAAANAKRAR